MARSTLSFFNKGVNEQKKPDIIFDFKRPDSSKISTWGKEEKKELLKFIDDCDKVYKRVRKEIIKSIK
jgi:hypothetical protein